MGKKHRGILAVVSELRDNNRSSFGESSSYQQEGWRRWLVVGGNWYLVFLKEDVGVFFFCRRWLGLLEVDRYLHIFMVGFQFLSPFFFVWSGFSIRGVGVVCD